MKFLELNLLQVKVSLEEVSNVLNKGSSRIMEKSSGDVAVYRTVIVVVVLHST